MIAGLPMYALPELASVTEALWLGLRRHFLQAGLEDVPERLTEPADLPEHWLDHDVLFTQTCGYPLTHHLDGQVQLVATPCYDAVGCDGPTYRSVVVVRDDGQIKTVHDLAGKRVAFNGTDSQSGYNTLRDLVRPLATRGQVFSQGIETGAHRKSLAAVREGKADVAAIDCVTVALLERVAPAEFVGIRQLCMTAPAPALPFITSRRTSAETLARLQAGLWSAMVDPDLHAVRKALLLKDIAILPIDAYSTILRMEQAAIDAGYPVLA